MLCQCNKSLDIQSSFGYLWILFLESNLNRRYPSNEFSSAIKASVHQGTGSIEFISHNKIDLPVIYVGRVLGTLVGQEVIGGG
jgi:hypothetical protein